VPVVYRLLARFTRATVEAVPTEEEVRTHEPGPPSGPVPGDGAPRPPESPRVSSPGTPEPAPIAYRTRTE
jgi:hypothetical protein